MVNSLEWLSVSPRTFLLLTFTRTGTDSFVPFSSDVSVVDLTARIEKSATYEEIKAAMKG